MCYLFGAESPGSIAVSSPRTLHKHLLNPCPWHTTATFLLPNANLLALGPESHTLNCRNPTPQSLHPKLQIQSPKPQPQGRTSYKTYGPKTLTKNERHALALQVESAKRAQDPLNEVLCLGMWGGSSSWGIILGVVMMRLWFVGVNVGVPLFWDTTI